MPITAPTDLSNLVAWWDASDATTFSFHSGALVSQWRDKSGASRHLAQSSSGDAPSRNVTSPAGPTAVRFNNKAVSTANGDNNYVTGTTLTFAFVAKRDADSSASAGRYVVGYPAGGQPDYGNNAAMIFESTAGVPAMYRDPGTEVDASPSVSVGDWFVCIAVWNGSTFQFYVNGATAGSASTSGSYDIDIFTLGRNNSGGEAGNHTIGEVAIYSDAKGSTDATSLTNYLTAKWLGSGGGAVALDGVASAANGATGALVRARGLTAISAAASAATGALGRARPVTAIASASSSATGALTAARPLTATTPAAASATGVLARGRDLTATSAASASAFGDIIAARAVAGSAAAAAAATGSLSTARPITGIASAAAGATGDLTTSSPSGFSGTASASASASGTLAAARALTATTTAASSATADLTVVAPNGFTGTASAASSASGALSTTRAFTAISAAASAAAGGMTRERALTANANAAASATGALTTANLSHPLIVTGPVSLTFLDPEPALAFVTVEPALRFLTEA